MKDNRWTIRSTEWTPRAEKRSRGRPPRRWRDDNEEFFGNTWTWMRTARERSFWRLQSEGYIQQWMNTA